MVITIKDEKWKFGKHDAFTFFPFIFIKESCKDNQGLIEHEKTHIKQFMNLKLWGYYLSKESKYQCEKEAYLVQLKYNYLQFKQNNPDKTEEDFKAYYDMKASHYAGYLQRNYGLDPGTDERFMKDAEEFYQSHFR